MSTIVTRTWLLGGVAAALLAGGGLTAGAHADTTRTDRTPPAATEQTSAAVPPGKVTVKLKAVGGTGCPKGSTKVAVNKAKTKINVRYSKYTAEVGPKVPTANVRRFCQLNVELKVPQGFSYAITKVKHHGHGKLARDTTGRIESDLHFVGEVGNGASESKIKLNKGKFTATRSLPDANLVWSRCGAAQELAIKSGLRIVKGASAKKTRSYVSMDTTKVTESTVFNLRWKTC